MLRFIEKTARPRLFSARISIHLMLRFIKDNFVHNFLFLSNFNTSHVTVYRVSISCTGRILTDFNTSHVTVYRLQRAAVRYQ